MNSNTNIAHKTFQTSADPVNDKANCLHCGLPVYTDSSRKKNIEHSTMFCCSACEFVYNTIHQLGLDNFYDYRNSQQAEASGPASLSNSKFGHFDSKKFREKYITTKDGIDSVQLFLPAIHCAACIWLLEETPKLDKGIISARVNYSKHRITINFDSKLSPLSGIARLLDSLGYTPHPISRDSLVNARKAENRKFLLKLGIAGAAAGNTMMMSVSLYQGHYTGMPSSFESFFIWFCLLATLPAVFYSATPFYRAAWAGLRASRLHIDLPISIGILAGFFASLINFLIGNNEVYFDSICMLIFLLLTGRWAQKRSLEKASDSAELMSTVTPISAIRIDDSNKREEVYIDDITPGDLIIAENGKTISVDGIIEEGTSHIDASILTGESAPEPVSPGTPVYAGTKNLDSELKIRTRCSGKESRIGKLISDIEESQTKKSYFTRITDRISGYFVFTVLGLASINFIYWLTTTDFSNALNTTLALLVVTCPCALGLSAPLALSIGNFKAARQGIIFKDSDVIENLSQCNHFAFDKTGTITHGNLEVLRFELKDHTLDVNRLHILNAIRQLENGISHPVARALLNFCSASDQTKDINDGYLKIYDRRIIAGKGVQGFDGSGRLWVASSLKHLRDSGNQAVNNSLFNSPNTIVAVSCAGKLLAYIELGDQIRGGFKQLFRDLTEKFKAPVIISGDAQSVVENVAFKLGLNKSNIFYELSPEEKLARIKKLNQSSAVCYIGDGANDAAALQAAITGIAVQGGAEVSLKVADAYITEANTEAIYNAIFGSRRSMKIIKINLGISLAYNIIGGSLAISGYISPLFAAILMPVSSLSVILSSSLLTSFDCSKKKSIN